MSTRPFSKIEFRHIALDTPHGRIEGLFSELRPDVKTLPDGLIPYGIRHGDDDSVPRTIETHVAADFFGTLLVAEAPDFGDADFIEILDWGFDEESDTTPKSIRKHLPKVKSFVDYFVERHKIDRERVRCIRTCGWDDEATIRVEYDDYAVDFKECRPVAMARRYLRVTFGYSPENLNFNNGHYDRIGCSTINVWNVGREDFDRYSKLPTVIHSQFDGEKECGSIEFAIHNEEQCALSYERKLYEYFR